LALAVSGRKKDFQEALQLVEQNENMAGPNPNPDDLDVKARVWSTQPDYHLSAIKLYETMAKQQPLNAGQQFILAQLYDRSDNWEKVRELMQGVLTRDPDNPLFRRTYILGLLRHDEVAQARDWLERFKSRPTNIAANTVVEFEMQTRLLAKEGKYQ